MGLSGGWAGVIGVCVGYSVVCWGVLWGGFWGNGTIESLENEVASGEPGKRTSDPLRNGVWGENPVDETMRVD